MSEKINRLISIVSLVFLLIFGVFFYGYFTVEKNLWPHSLIEEIRTIAHSLVQFHRIAPAGQYRKAAKDASRKILEVYQPSKVQPGYYAILGWNDAVTKYVVWLYTDTGKLLHTWELDYKKWDPDGPLNGSDSPHAFKMLSDGSIIVGFDRGDMLIRLGRDNQPIWIKSGIFHHSLDLNGDGTAWTWKGEGTAYSHYNYLTKLDLKTGNEITSIGLVEDIIQQNNNTSYIFGIRRDYPFEHFKRDPPLNEDLFHPNDVEQLPVSLANKFPQFKAGDLLLSFRNARLVAVLDPVTFKLKWWRTGPWRGQHDPDFAPDGQISIYNNNTGHKRSEIIKIDPRTNRISNELESGNCRFYSRTQGKHQYLPNGNVLIVVPLEGRVLITTADGNKVMEFNNVVPDLKGINGQVANAMWLPSDYFNNIPEWALSKSQGEK